MIGEIISTIALLSVIGYQGWLIWTMNRQHQERERGLLDRIMARNYEVLVQSDIAREQVKKSLTDEEIYDLQQERGIPV